MIIGVFDSGIGGLSVLKELKVQLPNCSFRYLSDKAHFPYGVKSRKEIIDYSLQSIANLIDQEIDILVIACHTVSTVALSFILGAVDIPVINVTDSMLKNSFPYQRMAVLGTEATVSSGVIQSRLKERYPELEIYLDANSELVSLIEEGRFDDTIPILKNYRKIFYRAQIEAVLLSCTHYPLIIEQMRGIWGASIKIYDPADSCARAVSRIVSKSAKNLSCNAMINNC